jgi:hypothetical protein
VPLVIPPNFAQVAIELRLVNDPEPMFVTFGVSAGTPVEGGGDFFGSTALVDIGTAFRTHFGAKMSSQYSVTGCKARIGTSGEPLASEVPLSLACTATGGAVPQNTAVLVRKLSALGGRRNRGRFFVPGAIETTIEPHGVMATGNIASWQTAADAFLAAVNGAGGVGNMVILHSTEALPAPPGHPEPTDVTALKVLELCATQRRRLRR